MKTSHQVYFQNSVDMKPIQSESVALVVTSPPYPMIGMWDELFFSHDSEIQKAIDSNNGALAFEAMHQQLDPVWRETYRILKPGGIACINIGDATRTIDGHFQLYSNHSRILTAMVNIGFSVLPMILWRKQTNTPNKFMGSGMMPPGAYVTLEHEYILILRKGRARKFSEQEKQNRRESSFFWEERNVWFSDVWMDLKGSRQKIDRNTDDSEGKDAKLRKRSGSFPFELPYRLINMFSLKGETVVDPFVGTGTTLFAAMATCRNGIGFEIESNFRSLILSNLLQVVPISKEKIQKRIKDHIDFVEKRTLRKGALKHENKHYQFPVMTRQETELFFHEPISVRKAGDMRLEVVY